MTWPAASTAGTWPGWSPSTGSTRTRRWRPRWSSWPATRERRSSCERRTAMPQCRPCRRRPARRGDHPQHRGAAPTMTQTTTEVVIGLDVGTTAVKAVAFAVGSSRRHTAVREYPLLQPEPGWRTQDPEVVLAQTWAALRESLSWVGSARVVAVSVSAAMHGLIGLDVGHRPLTPLVTWADGRSGEESRHLHSSGQATALLAATGTPVHPMSPLPKLMWFARHEPELCARVRWWVGLKEYLLLALSGTLATELSSASGTGLLDLAARDWHPDAIALAGITRDQLPPILATTAVLPLGVQAAARTGLPAGTPVVTGAADGPLGNLGTGATSPGVAGLSLGTSGALRVVVPEPRVDAERGLFCYALTDDAWVVGGAVSNGGAVVRWAGDVFGRDLRSADGGPPPDAALLELAGQVPAGSDGLVMLPYLLPERSPSSDPELTGAFLGIRHSHTRGHFVRAAVEGVAQQLAA